MNLSNRDKVLLALLILAVATCAFSFGFGLGHRVGEAATLRYVKVMT